MSTLVKTLALAFLLSPALGRASEVTLTFDPTTPLSGTSVRFTSPTSGVLSNAALADFALTKKPTDLHKYILMIDPHSFHRDKFHRFAFDAYVQETTDHSALSVHKFSVLEEPIGKFPDFVGDVTAHISGSSGDDIATLRLPQHSDDSPNLQVAVPTAPYPVPMGHPSRMELGLSSNLATLHLTVDAAVTVTPSKCPECWNPFNTKVLHDHLGLNQSTSLMIDLQPNTLAIFTRNPLVFDSTSPQDELVLAITSTSDSGGVDIDQEFRIPIRFTPPIPYLLAGILVGALIGAFTRFLMSLRNPPRLTSIDALIQIITALVAWVLVFGLFATKTKATVLGYDLDPTQLVPAGLIALLVAAGSPFGGKIAGVFGSRQ